MTPWWRRVWQLRGYCQTTARRHSGPATETAKHLLAGLDLRYDFANARALNGDVLRWMRSRLDHLSGGVGCVLRFQDDDRHTCVVLLRLEPVTSHYSGCGLHAWKHFGLERTTRLLEVV